MAPAMEEQRAEQRAEQRVETARFLEDGIEDRGSRGDRLAAKMDELVKAGGTPTDLESRGLLLARGLERLADE